MRACAPVTTLVTAVLITLLPTLAASTGPASAGAIAALSLALTALLVVAGERVVLRLRPAGVAPGDGARTPSSPRGSATDPVHHPLRPRAPGLR